MMHPSGTGLLVQISVSKVMSVTAMTEVHKIVLDTFGEELGSWLWINNKIIPTCFEVKEDGHIGKPPDTKLMKDSGLRQSHTTFTTGDFGKLVRMPVGLGVFANEHFSILDIDTKDIDLGSGNVETSRGKHYWISNPSEGGKRNVYLKDRHIGEMLANPNSYAVFYGEDRVSYLPDLYTWEEVTSRENISLSKTSSSDLTSEIHSEDSPSGLSIGINYGDSLEGLTIEQDIPNLDVFKRKKTKKKQATYVKFVEDSTGWVVDTERYEKAQCTQMQQMSHGTRNNGLFRKALEFHRLGLDTTKLEKAAMVAGLDGQETQRTIASAYARWENEDGVTVMDRVAHWLEAVEKLDPTEMQWDVALYAAQCAVEQHSLAPQVSQTRAARDNEQLSQKYVGTVLNTVLCKKGYAKKIVRDGLQANNLKHCNNYHLMIDGIALEEISIKVCYNK